MDNFPDAEVKGRFSLSGGEFSMTILHLLYSESTLSKLWDHSETTLRLLLTHPAKKIDQVDSEIKSYMIQEKVINNL